MKKKLVMTLITVCAVGMLAGCGGNEKSSEETAETTAEENAAETDEEDTLSKIQASGKLTVGTEGTYAPFTFYDDTDTLVGYDVEIARAVAEKMGVEAEFVETSWDGIIAGLDAGRFDSVFNQVTITDEREEKYNFSEPYTYAHGALIVAADNDEIKTFEDLADKTVAASLTSDWATMAEEYGGKVSSTTEFTESVTLVETKRADAVLNDELVYYDYVETTGDEGIKIAALTDEVNRNAVLVRKEDTTLVEAIDEALAELKEDGTLTELSEKYFGTDLSQE